MLSILIEAMCADLREKSKTTKQKKNLILLFGHSFASHLILAHGIDRIAGNKFAHSLLLLSDRSSAQPKEQQQRENSKEQKKESNEFLIRAAFLSSSLRVARDHMCAASKRLLPVSSLTPTFQRCNNQGNKNLPAVENHSFSGYFVWLLTHRRRTLSVPIRFRAQFLRSF